MSGIPDPRLPSGPLADAWRRTRETSPLISPLRKSQIDILVVGTGLAGASTAATLAQQGYRVTVLSWQFQRTVAGMVQHGRQRIAH